MNTLISRCLALGLTVLPFKQYYVFKQYETKKIPDEVLNKLNAEKLELYAKGLFLSGQEMSRDWTKGHEILKSLGFVEKKRSEGHRTFVRLEWQDTKINLCDTCAEEFATCKSGKKEFGDGLGNDNVIMCDNYKPTEAMQ